MTEAAPGSQQRVLERARRTLGISEAAVYRMVARAFARYGVSGQQLLDVGCGTGALWSFVRDRFSAYAGVDAMRYEGFPPSAAFYEANLETPPIPLPDASGDVVAAVETIEHLENPRAFMRELVRLAKPGGWILVTTPNQLSFLSLLTLVVKHRFSAFQDVCYPAHITALLEVDLRRMAAECGLRDIATGFSHQGRIILTQWHYPRFVPRLLPRACSDTVFVLAHKPPRSSAPAPAGAAP